MRCKNCKEKIEVVRFNQKFCLDNDECIKAFVEYTKAKEWLKRKKKMKAELETVQELLKKTQITFNTYIRLRDKSKGCISCNKPLTSKYDAGHFYSSGGHKSVTFNEDNCHGQCVECNRHKHGNLIPYQENLIKRIGLCRYKELKRLSKLEIKYSRDELRQIGKKYKEKCKEVK